MPQLPSIPETIQEKIQRALEFYDGRLNNKPKNKGFFSFITPDPIPIKIFRELNKSLILDGSEKNEALVLQKIRNVLRNNSYPNEDTNAFDTELMLDYLLFDGDYYMSKCDYNDPLGKRAYLLQHLMLNNLLHFGNVEMMQRFYLDPENQERLNKDLIMATANASVESIQFVLRYCGEAVDLGFYSDTANMHNNALMLALAKGRLHKDYDKASLEPLNDIIDLYLRQPSFASDELVVNHQDRFGMTALHIAILQRDILSAQKLVNELHADPSLQDKEGNTVYKYLEFSYEECQERLAAYTVAQDFHGYLTDNENKGTMDRLRDYFFATYTMPKKEKWLSNEKGWSALLEHHPLRPPEPPPSP